jgi:hypothetical protein
MDFFFPPFEILLCFGESTWLGDDALVEVSPGEVGRGSTFLTSSFSSSSLEHETGRPGALLESLFSLPAPGARGRGFLVRLEGVE